ncbi:hypothetical protein KRZ98_16700 [Sphingobium sp. AS12]|uniref:hypothetical protein n=1 Tax=Sphingobium sp. AS12 TaxID=2849495 RepID=UPI001C31DC35|nr:hypothetical protein [Sphingobium sp. AS12]MBV2149885.1 hypothetical protein [Sphingobium sp. AS12]
MPHLGEPADSKAALIHDGDKHIADQVVADQKIRRARLSTAITAPSREPSPRPNFNAGQKSELSTTCERRIADKAIVELEIQQGAVSWVPVEMRLGAADGDPLQTSEEAPEAHTVEDAITVAEPEISVPDRADGACAQRGLTVKSRAPQPKPLRPQNLAAAHFTTQDRIIPMRQKIDPAARLNGFAKAHEFACRRADAGVRHLAIIRTGLPDQPFRVTTSPKPTDEIVLSIAD